MHDEQFISEPIVPESGTFSPDLMARGLAAIPSAFTWRNQRYVIVECLDHEKVSTPEGGREGNEVYLRRQVFTVRLESGEVARIYFERQSRPGSSRKSARQRWFLYSIASG